MNAANYVSDSVQGATNTSAKEANKNVARDSDTSIGTRASAAKDAAVNKKDETVHNTKADTNKEAAKH
ncbi:Glucose-repressible protein [Penicillium angulare]|uniref:Glucose-repressible protein n=1 Tax=Penicillium angulare TaxID=116970 RepID=UPI002540A71E|nr:Glucose-repressible protein [Penicillium angulare]KAJ5292130.1 Glucose-repressible protein [Penicillium angulare]